MTPQEKAAELIEKYYSDKCFNGRYGEDYNAKHCALICVDEIMKIVPSVYVTSDEEIHNGHYEWWNKVKEHINKL